MTLNGRNVTLAEITKNGAHKENLIEDRFTLPAAKCRPMILVSRNITYYIICGYSRGFLGVGVIVIDYGYQSPAAGVFLRR